MDMIFSVADGFKNRLKNIFSFGVHINFIMCICISFTVVFQHLDKLQKIDIYSTIIQLSNINCRTGAHTDPLDAFPRNHFPLAIILPEYQVEEQPYKRNENKYTTTK